MESNSLVALAVASSLLGTVISSFAILSHLKAYSRPLIQRYIIRILLIVPVYALASAISLLKYSFDIVVRLFFSSALIVISGHFEGPVRSICHILLLQSTHCISGG